MDPEPLQPLAPWPLRTHHDPGRCTSHNTSEPREPFNNRLGFSEFWVEAVRLDSMFAGI